MIYHYLTYIPGKRQYYISYKRFKVQFLRLLHLETANNLHHVNVMQKKIMLETINIIANIYDFSMIYRIY
jgi:hypothetical protein